MTAQQIQTYRDAEPFTPFEIVLGDGRVVPVSRHDAVSFAPSKKLVAVDVGGAFSHYDVTNVVELRPLRVPDWLKKMRGS